MPERHARFASVRTRFPTARMVFAEVDQNFPVNREELDQAVTLRIISPALNHKRLFNSLRKQRNEDPLEDHELKNYYLIPMRYQGASKEEVLKSDSINPHSLWGRSMHYQDTESKVSKRAFVFKGSALPSRGETDDSIPLPIYEDVSDETPETRLRGGARKGTLKISVDHFNELSDEYKKALIEGDPVALAANKIGITDLPIPRPVAVFKILGLPILKEKKLVRSKDFSHISQDLLQQLRSFLYTVPHPHRNLEIEKWPKAVNLNAILTGSYLEKKGQRFFIQDRELSRKDAADYLLTRHAIVAALMVHLANNRMGESLSTPLGSPFNTPNSGVGTFNDLDFKFKRTDLTYFRDKLFAIGSIRQTNQALFNLFNVFSNDSKQVDLFNDLLVQGENHVKKHLKA